MLRIILKKGLTRIIFGIIIPNNIETEINTDGKGYLMISMYARGGGRGLVGNEHREGALG
jgi:hypothetical protein